MKSDERELIRRFGAGDRQAFDILFARYAGRVLGFAVRLTGNRSDAEDLVQETFVAAYKGCSTFQGRSGVLTWLLGIAARRWRDRLRRPAPEVTAFEDVIESESGSLYPQAESLEIRTVTSIVTADALNKLDAPFREALLLVASQGLTYREAAEALGEPVGTVKWRVSEAARRIRRVLSGMADDCNEMHTSKRR